MLLDELYFQPVLVLYTAVSVLLKAQANYRIDISIENVKLKNVSGVGRLYFQVRKRSGC